jgi:hypothetical protein
MKMNAWSKKFKTLVALTIISGIALIGTLAAYIWAVVTARTVLETSMGTAFGLASLAFSVFLGATLTSSPNDLKMCIVSDDKVY